jgi:mRNA-degrading endonuclease RelE of RelBE toxin-antitoxin system
MNTKVALAQDFLSNLSKLPSAIQSKVLKWALKFQSDPTASSINYETIKGARDKNLRSVRIDQDWRGIVFKPDKGDVYVLMYVDKHDDAYHWAETRRVAINPVTGAMQLFAVERAEEAPEAEVAQPEAIEAAASPAGLYATLSDAELLSIGTPEELIHQVRNIRSEEELDAMQEGLPVEAYEGLFLIAAGDTVSDVLTARETRVDKKVDTEDYAAALETAESQARFVVVDDPDTMTAIMNAPLAQWRVVLHPTQRKCWQCTEPSGSRSTVLRMAKRCSSPPSPETWPKTLRRTSRRSAAQRSCSASRCRTSMLGFTGFCASINTNTPSSSTVGAVRRRTHGASPSQRQTPPSACPRDSTRKSSKT